MHPHSVYVTVSGDDRPGVTSALFAALAAHDVEVLDIEQVVVRGRLTLGAVLALHGDPGTLRRAATHAAEALGTEVEVLISTEPPEEVLGSPTRRHHVVVLGRPLRAGAVSEAARRIADLGGNIDSINRLVSTPVTGLELMVSGADHAALGATLVAAARETGIDVAIERGGHHRRAKRLLLLDLDTVLLGGDAWSELAVASGRGAESDALLLHGAQLTGEEIIRAKASLLAGLPVAALDAIADRAGCGPGVAELVTAVRRMGYRVGVVSGGVAQVAARAVEGLGLDFLAGTTLDSHDGVLTGGIVGDLTDRPGRARALERFAEMYGVPLAQTVAVGGGDVDVDMLNTAGLGMTVTGVAGGAPATRFDALLFVLGMGPEDDGDPDPAALLDAALPTA